MVDYDVAMLCVLLSNTIYTISRPLFFSIQMALLWLLVYIEDICFPLYVHASNI